MRNSAIIGLTLSVALLALSACSPPPTAEELAKMDLGPAPTNHKELITDFFNRNLKDPYTAEINIGEPERWWMRDGLIYGAKVHTGWLVKAIVNAKNSFGGYTGYQTYGFLFRDGVIIKIITPEDWKFFK